MLLAAAHASRAFHLLNQAGLDHFPEVLSLSSRTSAFANVLRNKRASSDHRRLCKPTTH